MLERACKIQLRLCYNPMINDYMDNSHKHLIHCSHNLGIYLMRGITCEVSSWAKLCTFPQGKNFQHTASDPSGTSIFCSYLELHDITPHFEEKKYITHVIPTEILSIEICNISSTYSREVFHCSTRYHSHLFNTEWLHTRYTLRSAQTTKMRSSLKGQNHFYYAY